MNIDNISWVVGSLGGSFFVSFLIGYFLKKVIKILMFVLGGILALLMYLQSQGIVNVSVNIDKVQSAAEAVLNSIAVNTTSIVPNNNNSPSTVTDNLSIPLTGAISSGLMLGLTRRG